MDVFVWVFRLALVVPVLLFFLFFFVYSRLTNVRDDSVPFECGFDPKRMSRVPFSLRFFLLAVIFLIFDVEVALLFPLCYCLYSVWKVLILFFVFLFLLVVCWGLFLEWFSGALDWVEG